MTQQLKSLSFSADELTILADSLTLYIAYMHPSLVRGGRHGEREARTKTIRSAETLRDYIKTHNRKEKK